MISKPLDELYLEWLYSQVAGIDESSRFRTYWSLFRKLYTTEFIWFVANDDNRVEDGKDLRKEFEQDHIQGQIDQSWMELGCSFLEMMIALSRRLEFETGRPSDEWFWHILGNLGLSGINDAIRFPEEDIEDILNVVIWRTYDIDGNGGMFPLRRGRKDLRKAELWYQANAYILENE